MKRGVLARWAVSAIALFMGAFFGFSGLAVADHASISYTGPGSVNKIDIEHKDECDVENNNNVTVNNNNNQNARTGNANVGGSDWGNYDPAAWAAEGYSYEEWESAFNSYMQEKQSEWRNNWGSYGGGNTRGGDATSGDATNVSHQSMDVSIDNSGACAQVACCDVHGNPVKPGQKPTHDENGHVLSAGAQGAGVGGNGAAGGLLALGAGGPGSVLGAKPGAPGKVSVFNPACNCDVNVFSISNTGPESFNKISYEESRDVNVTNNNNVTTNNNSNQDADSGNAGVNGNTSAGGSGTGDSANTSGQSTSTSVDN